VMALGMQRHAARWMNSPIIFFTLSGLTTAEGCTEGGVR
jgi:hypothetical protein